MYFEKDGQVYNERQVRESMPKISLPATLLPAHVAEYGFIEYIVPPYEETTVDIVNRKLREIQELATQHLASFAYDFGEPNGILHLRLREVTDVTNWLTLRGTATDMMLGGDTTTLLPLRTEEDITIMLPPPQISSVMGALALYGSQVMATSWALKDQLENAVDPSTVDVTVGWPV